MAPARLSPTLRARAAPRALRWMTLLATAACVAVHAAMLVSTPSLPTALMLILAAACALCLRPRSAAPSDASWGSALAMSAAMLLLHVGSTGRGSGGHAHAGSAMASGAAVNLLHRSALGLNAAELALLMGAAIAIGVRNRRAGERRAARFPEAGPRIAPSAVSGTGPVNID